MIISVQNPVRLDIGKNSMGKTPTQIFDLSAYQKVYPWKKYLISEGQDKFSDAHKRGALRIDWILPNHNPDIFKRLQEFKEPTPGNKIYTYADSVLIIDDLKLRFKGFDTPTDFLALLTLRPSPKFNMNIWLNCHEPRNIPDGIAGYITHYHIYANEASAGQFQDKISCHFQCQRASLVINKYQKMFPGYYDVKTHTPYFPHIIVEKDNPEVLHCVNMDYEKAKPILQEFTNQSS